MEPSLRGYKYRLYLTESQERTLEEWQRSCFAIWNMALEHRQSVYESEKKTLWKKDQIQELQRYRRERPYLRMAPAQVGNKVLDTLDEAYKRFLKDPKTVGRPRRKKIREMRSMPLLFTADKGGLYTHKLDGTPSNTSGSFRITCENDGWLRLRFGTKKSRVLHLSVRMHRRFPSHCRIKSASITHKAGRWYVSLGVESYFERQGGSGKIGINRGLRTPIALSTGENLTREVMFEPYDEKMKALQKEISQLERRNKPSAALGSRKRRRQHLETKWRQFAHLQGAVAKRREEWAHLTVNDLISRFDYIAIEDYSIKKMLEETNDEDFKVKEKRLHRRIADAAWADFARILQYKAEEAGVHLVKVPSANITTHCSSCGKAFDFAELESARYNYPVVLCNCSPEQRHIDVNAAQNVLQRAEKEDEGICPVA